MAEEKKIQVVFMGKTYEIKPGEYDGLVDQVFKSLERYIKSLIDNNTHNQKVYREYLEQAKVKNGFFDAITQAVIVEA